MKKKYMFAVISGMLMVLFGLCQINGVYASAQPVKVFCRYSELKFDQTPVLQNGQVLVPARQVFEALEAEVSWDGASKTATARTGSKKIVLTVGSSKAQVDSDIRGIKTSKEIRMDVPVKMIGGRTMVPVTFIAESLNKRVSWDESRKAVHIDESVKDLNGNILGSYKHVTKKILKNDMTVYYESSEALGLSKTLGMNIEEEIFKICGNSPREIYIFTPVKAGISSNDKNDFLVNVSVFGDSNNQYEKKLFLVFAKEHGKYVIGYNNYVNYGKGNEVSYDLIDIDSDRKSEILLETAWTGMGNADSDTVILKYIDGKAATVFNESLNRSSKSDPFSCNSTISFVRNDSNKSVYDILFKLEIDFDQDTYERSLSWETHKDVPVEKQKNLTETYLFKFDGKKYISDKPLIDYRSY